MFRMSNIFLGSFVSDICERLRTEREALGMSQEVFAEQCGVGARSQRNYESGERLPDAAYLAAAATAGADVRYIVTGKRDGPAPLVLSSEERVMLDYFRQASPPIRKAALGALLSASSGSVSGSYNRDDHRVSVRSTSGKVNINQKGK